MIKASGTKASLAEVAQQLAWISSALPVRPPSPDPSIGASCTPSLVQLDKGKSKDGQPVPEPLWGIRVETTYENPRAGTSNGRCWTKIVQNRVIAQGYPIRRRPERRTGAEPLHFMSELLNAPYATVFNGRMFIKGPRAMFPSPLYRFTL